jgi:AcrR family transcriptional regulator
MGVDIHSRRRAHGKTQRGTQSTDGADRTQRPHGREEVMAAVLDAATALFATRGPASVSVRDIAAAASINHALVHRHFSSKQEVLRAVLEQTVQEVAAIAAEITDAHAGIGRLFAASAAHETYWRGLARALLDGENPRTLQRDFPTVHRLITLLQPDGQQRRRRPHQSASSGSRDVRVVVGALCALMLGWLVFEPFLLVATGLDQEDQAKVREQVVLMLQAMMANVR